MKTFSIDERDNELLWRLKLALANQAATPAALATESPVFVVWFGRHERDPERRINAICFTEVEAEVLMKREAHRGKMFIEVCSCARAPLSSWLLKWALRVVIEDHPEPERQTDLFGKAA